MCPLCILSSSAVIVSGLTSAGGIGAFAINTGRVRALVTGSAKRIKASGSDPSSERRNTQNLKTQEKAS